MHNIALVLIFVLGIGGIFFAATEDLWHDHTSDSYLYERSAQELAEKLAKDKFTEDHELLLNTNDAQVQKIYRNIHTGELVVNP